MKKENAQFLFSPEDMPRGWAHLPRMIDRCPLNKGKSDVEMPFYKYDLLLFIMDCIDIQDFAFDFCRSSSLVTSPTESR